MNKAANFASSSASKSFNMNNSSPNISIGMPDKLTLLFERIFSTNEKIRNKNKFLLLFLNSLIQLKETDLINRYLNDDALRDFHPSLLKSTLLIIQPIDGVKQEYINNVQRILDSKI